VDSQAYACSAHRLQLLTEKRVFGIAIVVDALRRIVDRETAIDPTIVSRLVGGAAGRTRWPSSASGNGRSSG
jgi:hypothetical protein